jgi:Cu/Ag efflux protein CusF
MDALADAHRQSLRRLQAQATEACEVSVKEMDEMSGKVDVALEELESVEIEAQQQRQKKLRQQYVAAAASARADDPCGCADRN